MDAILLMSDAPYPLFADLAQGRDIKLISLTEKESKYVLQQNPGLSSGVVPKGTYRGVDYETKTVQQYTCVLVNKDIPEAVVYGMVKAINANLEKLRQSTPAMKGWDPKLFAVDIKIPFHPGAEKYYKEQGWLK